MNTLGLIVGVFAFSWLLRDKQSGSSRSGLSGLWSGHYENDNQTRPIAADITQQGDRLSGTMHDEVTESEWSLFDMAARAGLPPGADEQIDQQLRFLFPALPKQPLRSVWRLPADSTLSGIVEGQAIRLVKKYEGEHFFGYRAGDQEIGVTLTNHQVLYEGTVADDGNTIEGLWSFFEPDRPNQPFLGLFALQRRDAVDEE